jgi:hypothetical protein
MRREPADLDLHTISYSYCSGRDGRLCSQWSGTHHSRIPIQRWEILSVSARRSASAMSDLRSNSADAIVCAHCRTGMMGRRLCSGACQRHLIASASLARCDRRACSSTPAPEMRRTPECCSLPAQPGAETGDETDGIKSNCAVGRRLTSPAPFVRACHP